MLIGARLIPLLFPTLGTAEGAEGGAVFDLGIDPDALIPDEEGEPTTDDPEAEPEAAPSPLPYWWPVAEAEPWTGDQTAPEAIKLDVAPLAAPPAPDALLPETAEMPTVAPQQAEDDVQAAPEMAPDSPTDTAPPEPEAKTETRPAPEAGHNDHPPNEGDTPDPQARDQQPPPDTPAEPVPDAPRPDPAPEPAPEQIRPHAIDRAEVRSAAPEVEAARKAAPAPETAPLSPEPPAAQDDLGQIQVMFEREGDATRITLIADKPETVDLMRRNADQLQQELTREGFSHTDLNFAERDQDQDAPPPKRQGDASIATLTPLAQMQGTGLDLRL